VPQHEIQPVTLIPKWLADMGLWVNRKYSVEQLRSYLERDFQEVSIQTTVYPSYGGGKRETAHFVVRSPIR
jgi:hypothetical protein